MIWSIKVHDELFNFQYDRNYISLRYPKIHIYLKNKRLVLY